jgi:phosphatidylglycerophosphatase A
VNGPHPVRIVLTHPAGWIASGFGVGLSPRAPGTVGSLAALLPWWFFLQHLSLPAYLELLLAAFAVGVWSANWVIRKTRIEDPSVVVWDEFIGQWIALLLAPAGWPWMVGGFVLFRLFDIWKPWPVSWADQKLHGGLGAMLDDVLAGIYALACLQGIAFLLAV